MQRRLLGVNIDHIATLRQARGTKYPDPVAAAALAEHAGADQITVHLREDRRHIQDRDVRLLRQTVQTVLNLEMAATAPMLQLACDVQPDRVTLVPERREELTTEGGLDVAGRRDALANTVAELARHNIPTSMFIDPEPEQVRASHAAGAPYIELHTGRYCELPAGPQRQGEYQRLLQAAALGQSLGLRVAAGHGLNIHNVAPLVPCADIEEYNIGHSIVAQAAFVGLERAVQQMLDLLTCA
jgi:pyridoxine 5-phosphate synthase